MRRKLANERGQLDLGYDLAVGCYSLKHLDICRSKSLDIETTRPDTLEAMIPIKNQLLL